MRDVERRQHANGACELWPPCADRQQQKLEVDRFTDLVLRRHRRNRADAFVSKDRKQVGHGGPACRGPEAEKGFPLELPAEQRADPRAGEANRMTGTAIERKDEGVAERAANGAGLNVGALGRGARPALLLPIGIKLPARGVLHEELLPYSCRRSPCPRLGQGSRRLAVREARSRACAVRGFGAGAGAATLN